MARWRLSERPEWLWDLGREVRRISKKLDIELSAPTAGAPDYVWYEQYPEIQISFYPDLTRVPPKKQYAVKITAITTTRYALNKSKAKRLAQKVKKDMERLIEALRTELKPKGCVVRKIDENSYIITYKSKLERKRK